MINYSVDNENVSAFEIQGKACDIVADLLILIHMIYNTAYIVSPSNANDFANKLMSALHNAENKVFAFDEELGRKVEV